MSETLFSSNFPSKEGSGSRQPGGRQPPKTARVKNKQAAPVQITSEQILRDAKGIQEAEPKPPKQKITDPEELADYRLRKRQGFENQIRRQRHVMALYIKYADWEDSQREFARARSIFERAIEVDHRDVRVWLKYTEMEMKNKFVNHARNVWDRAVTILPRIDQLWLKYAHMEEVLGNVPGTRSVFERWMQWEPDLPGWYAYIKMELRYGEVERARQVYERLVTSHPTVEAWLKYAKFEEKQGEVEKARAVFARAVELLSSFVNDDQLYVAFAQFEERHKEMDRARVIYKYALDHVPKHNATDLYKMYTQFEKQHGSQQSIEDVIINKRRFQYEEELKKETRNYDVWFDYIRLEETQGERDRVREVYERAIANVPPLQEKRYWRRYIYLWINYALYEELEAKDIDRAREVYRECLKLVPHHAFSFAKVWIMAAHFEIRQKDLAAARTIFGNAIGRCGKDKIFKAYIQVELQLGEIDRCRKLYEKQLEINPASCDAWIRFSELEKNLNEVERARAIFELAVAQPLLDMPERLWKSFIDFEIANDELDRTRALYERLLDRTKHVKVWISFALFEGTAGGDVAKARTTFERAYKYIRQNSELKEERVMLLEAWRDFEKDQGPSQHLEAIRSKMPKRVKKKRPIKNEDGTTSGWEEFQDYIFPDDEQAAPNLKLLEKAHRWKRQKLQQTATTTETS